MKKGRLFPTIIYYLFTFLLGIILALTLPPYFYNFNKLPNYIESSLEKGDFYSAMLMTAHYFNKQIVYAEKIDDNAGIILFETVMPAVKPDEEDATALQEGFLYKTFWGFVYGTADSYDTYNQSINQTRLEIVDTADGSNTITVQLLDFDNNNDSRRDGISTHKNYGFILLDLSSNTLSTIDGIGKLVFYDVNGEVFWQSQQISLNFDSDYFNQFDEYIEQYNQLTGRLANASGDTEVDLIRSQLEEVYYSFREGYVANPDNVVIDKDNDDYMQTYKKVYRQATGVSSAIVVAYFVAIYIIGDFLLGSHYILKFFRWFLYKVCKVKPKNKQKLQKEEVFGHDYYSMVTVSLDLEAVPDFNESVQVKYTNSDAEVVFILLKENGYTATERIKAGIYVNPFIDMNRDYAPTNLPDNLEVEGYKVEVKIKIIKREV